jgi:outer membrane protein
MRKFLPLAAFLLVLGWAQTAQAQYANKSITIAGGYLFTDKGVGFDGAIPLYIGGSLYLEGGVELYTHFPLAFVRDNLSAGRSLVLGWGNHTGVRYLLREDYLRPYVGAELAFLQILRDTLYGGAHTSVGPGVIAGVEYFVSESISIGVRAQVNVFLNLDLDTLFSYGGAATVGIWFN